MTNQKGAGNWKRKLNTESKTETDPPRAVFQSAMAVEKSLVNCNPCELDGILIRPCYQCVAVVIERLNSDDRRTRTVCEQGIGESLHEEGDCCFGCSQAT